MLVGLAVGVLLGTTAVLLHDALPHAVFAIVDPYLFLVVVIVTGRLSLGFGWALVNSALASFGVLISQLTAMAVVHGQSPLDFGGGGGSLNRLLFLMVLSGALACLTQPETVWGDAAAGALAALFFADVVDDVAAWIQSTAAPAWQWASGAAIALGLGCVTFLRPRAFGRLRALGIALALVALYALAVAVQAAI